MKQVSVYDRHFTNEQLKDLPVSKELVNIEANYLRILSQAASIPQAIKGMQKEKERADLF